MVCVSGIMEISRRIIRMVQTVLHSREFLYSFREIEKPLIFQIFAE